MKKTGKVLNSLEDYILAAMLMVMTILAFINVIMRYVLLSSLPWIEELNRLGLVILSYTGAAVALKNHSHLGLSIVTDKLSPGERRSRDFSAACAAFSSVGYPYTTVSLWLSRNIRTTCLRRVCSGLNGFSEFGFL